MNDITGILLILAVYILLQRWILPKLGVQT